jgi:hypothetical protein
MAKILKGILTIAVFFAAGSLVATEVAADTPAAPASGKKLSTGLTPLAQLLALMDTDKNGKVSKEEFMSFMQAEFDFADKNKDGELDPTELKNMVYHMNHPSMGLPRVRK